MNKNIDSNIEYLQCDITNPNDINKTLIGINTIFHTASVIDIRYSPSPLLYDVNVNGTKNILKFCNDKDNHKNEVKNLIYTSTFEVINVDGQEFKDTKESDTINVYGKKYFNGYGQTKSMAEQMVIENKLENIDLNVSAIRLGAVYGVDSPILEQSLKNGQPYIIGEGMMSLSYVENAAFAHIQIAEAISDNSDNGVDGQVFHYKDADETYGEFVHGKLIGHRLTDIKRIPYSIAIIMATISDWKQYIDHKWFNKLNKKNGMDRLTILAAKMSQGYHTINTDKFNKTIGYNPPYTIEQSIEKTKNWINDIKVNK